MEYVVALAAVILGIYRTWHTPLYPLVFATYFNSLKYWLSLRVPFFYSNTYLLDIAFVGLVLLAIARHVVPDWRRHIRPTSIEVGLILAVIYSWISFTWTPPVPFPIGNRPDFVSHTMTNQIVYLVLLPLLLRAGLNRIHELPRDFLVIGLTTSLLLSQTLDWYNRGARYLFEVTDPVTGAPLEIGSNALGTALFASTMILAAVIFVRRSWIGMAVSAAIVFFSADLLIESQTRGQTVATILALMAFVPVANSYIRRENALYTIPLLAVGSVVAVLLSTTVIPETLANVGFDESYYSRFSKETMLEDVQDRRKFIGDVTDAWLRSPFAMVFGLGTASSYYYTGSYIHNVVLEVLYEQGVFIWLIYFYVLMQTIMALGKTFFTFDISRDDRRSLGFFGALFFVLLLSSLKEGAFYNSCEFMLIIPCCAILSDWFQKRAGRSGGD